MRKLAELGTAAVVLTAAIGLSGPAAAVNDEPLNDN